MNTIISNDKKTNRGKLIWIKNDYVKLVKSYYQNLKKLGDEIAQAAVKDSFDKISCGCNCVGGNCGCRREDVKS